MAERGLPLLLGEMTTGQVREYVSRDHRALLPFGSLEQNGPHLPIGTDTLVACKVAELASARTGVPVLPPIPWGLSWPDYSWPGTVSLPGSELAAMYKSLCTDLAHTGLNQLLVVSGHLGNVWAAGTVGGELEVAGVTTVVLDVWRTMVRVCGDLVTAALEPFGHGGELMTAVVLAINPELVRWQAVTAGPDSGPIGFRRRVPRDQDSTLDYPDAFGFARWETVSESGIVGEPGAATAEVGRKALERVTNHAVDLLSGLVAPQADSSPDDTAPPTDLES